jgi:hypothetical protein
MLTAIVLTVLVLLCRILCSTLQIWNFAPLGAISLYAGSRLPRRWAWALPVAAMLLTDVILDHDRTRPAFELTRWVIYATYAVTTLLGPLANRPKIGVRLLPLLAVSSSVLFFATSNLATWAEGQLYPITLSGLLLCYTEAIPFFGNTIMADLLGTAVLFGLGPFFERAAHRLSRPRLAEIPQEVDTTQSTRSA